jgi:hypothetical protein
VRWRGAKVLQAACTGTAAQHFEPRADTGGSYRLVDVGSGKSLDVTDVSTANGAKIQQWTTSAADNQRFLVSTSGTGFALKAVNSDKCLDITDHSTQAGGALQQWDCSGGGKRHESRRHRAARLPEGGQPEPEHAARVEDLRRQLLDQVIVDQFGSGRRQDPVVINTIK